MPELVLLSFDRGEFRKLHKAALSGDEQAVQQIETIFAAYKEQGVACFLCDSETHEPFCMMLPDGADYQKLIAAPLCTSCRDLAPMQRWHRCLKLLSKMAGARLKKQVHFDLVGRRR